MRKKKKYEKINKKYIIDMLGSMYVVDIMCRWSQIWK